MTTLRVRRAAWVLATAVLAACGSGTPAEPDRAPASIVVVNGDQQDAVVATSTGTRPAVRVRDASGTGVPNTTVTFTVTAGGGWVSEATVPTDAQGHASTSWYLGPAPGVDQTLHATASGFTVEFAANATPLVEGATYTGAQQYVEFIAGDLPVVVSAPHGGTLEPASIPDRSGANATTIRDFATDDLAFETGPAFEARTGGAPHIIVLHLHRIKLDANRELGEAAEGNAAAERAWREYHGFIDAAREHVVAAHGTGFYLDLHGHGHDVQRLELGYLLTSAQLAGDDASLNEPAIVQRSSIRRLAEDGAATHAELLRGAHSLGTLLEAEGYPAVPSAAQPDPGADPYFTGGYSTDRHGSRHGGLIDGVQIEANRIGVRDTDANRKAFAAALARAVEAFFEAHYGAITATAVAR